MSTCAQNGFESSGQLLFGSSSLQSTKPPLPQLIPMSLPSLSVATKPVEPRSVQVQPAGHGPGAALPAAPIAPAAPSEAPAAAPAAPAGAPAAAIAPAIGAAVPAALLVEPAAYEPAPEAPEGAGAPAPPAAVGGGVASVPAAVTGCETVMPAAPPVAGFPALPDELVEPAAPITGTIFTTPGSLHPTAPMSAMPIKLPHQQ